METLKMHSLDGVQRNIELIGKLFPNAITEVKRDGKVEHAIDFDVLRQELSGSIVEGLEERYQFTWPDKKKAMLAANAPITATLRPVVADSVGKDGTPGGFDSENLYIEGDNLEVLKLLQETYLGKVKMIYIDPPYNTGNDFVYEDDFAQRTEDYMGNSGQYDEEGNRMVTNTESNGRFHTDWLNMIYPRLKLAKDLLAEDGVIFISIDDGEAANLLKVCNDIFGESNFVADLIWQKKFSRSNDATYFSTMHDHILCYCKSNIMQNENGWRIGLLPRDDEIPNGYANPDNDPRGVWTSVILSAKSGSDSLLYEIQTPSGRKVLPPSGRYWSCSKDTFEKWKADGRIWFGSNGDGTPRKKTFLSEVQQGLRPNTILFQDSVGNNQEAKQETKALFNGCGVFDGPKPVRLLNVLLKIANTKDDSIILDFFSGSATTAHAVMKLNAEDGGHRKFIMVQLPEKTDEKSEAYKAGYKNICEIGKERIRRAGRKIKEDAGLTAPADLDIGFRCLRLDESNMKPVYYTPEEISQQDMFSLVDNVKSDRTPEDLLFQVMLDLGVLLSSPIEVKEIAGKKVFNVADGFLLACFDHDVTEETVKAIAQMKPYYAVFRDNSMANDSVATNFDQIFETYSPETVRKVL
ncbi:site-specific DNA-methyltransferase [Faecalibacterium duncaniae]|uniref:site-specific DNA-methyltransferase n=1 Tax=Faecalibacterium duncaniae (strain DSM 17677 / JCM 31915 / A2-165) TaxID=411483 RepID=UPI0029406674|nr:site-specific DNA-methyltransferase [Faecalibacterium duncaniae]MDV5041364.1 site-specific DNA-methyltransferase [Faecalibacterium duncaniae]